jgi:hypothetical protein
MIVIQTQRRTLVLTGWQAWLAGTALLALAWLVLAFLAFIWIGITVTLAAMLLLILPAMLIAVALQS